MILPRGITGFGGLDTELPPRQDEKAFRRLCYSIAQGNGETVTEVDADTTERNFYFAKIQKYDASVFILQNIHYPYIAFAQRDASGAFIMTNPPQWLRLPEGPMRFLGPSELNQDWRGLSGELCPEELEQIHYWNPQTVGEILFNTWD